MTDMTDSRRERVRGSIFRDKGSSNWRIKYSDRGRTHREGTHSPDKKVAEKLLRLRLAEITTGTFTPRSRVYVEELIADVQADYTNSGRKSTAQIEGRWRLHLSPFFARRRASDVTTDLLRRYVTHRRGEGASPASVNREMALLRRAFHLGHRATPPKVTVVPHFPMSREAEPRKGFLKPEHYAALSQACSDVGGLWLRSIFETASSFGFRLHEMVGKNGLRVEQIDFVGNIIRLEVMKNGEPREVFMTSTVRELLRQCCAQKSGADLVVSRGRHPVITFNRSWKKACLLAGVAKLLCPECQQELNAERHCAACDRDWNAHETKYSGLLVHDLRRPAVRNLVRAGIPETVCQAISGHRSRSVFDRYNITSQSDLREAARKLELHRAREVEQVTAASATDAQEQELEPSRLQ